MQQLSGLNSGYPHLFNTSLSSLNLCKMLITLSTWCLVKVFKSTYSRFKSGIRHCRNLIMYIIYCIDYLFYYLWEQGQQTNQITDVTLLLYLVASSCIFALCFTVWFIMESIRLLRGVHQAIVAHGLSHTVFAVVNTKLFRLIKFRFLIIS